MCGWFENVDADDGNITDFYHTCCADPPCADPPSELSTRNMDEHDMHRKNYVGTLNIAHVMMMYYEHNTFCKVESKFLI